MLAGVHDIGKEWYVEPGRRDEFRAILMRDGKVEDFVSEIYRHKTRERIWITESARLVCDRKTGRPLFYEGSVREITETMKRLQLEEQFQKLTSQLPGGLFQFRNFPDDRQLQCSISAPASRASPAISLGGASGAAGELQRSGRRRRSSKPISRRMQEPLQTLEPWDHEFRIRTRDGEEKWLRIDGTAGTVGRRRHLARLCRRHLRAQEAGDGDRGACLFRSADRAAEPPHVPQPHGAGDRRPASGAATPARCCSSTSTISRR